jgi:hypothetical protein
VPSFAKRDLADLQLQPLTRWSIFGSFSQSCSDVISLGGCGGKGDGAMPLDFRRCSSS